MPQRCTTGTCLGPSKGLAKSLRRAIRAAVETLESRTLLSAWFVSTTGADTNPGTLAAPFKTIQHAADVAHPGDVVQILRFAKLGGGRVGNVINRDIRAALRQPLSHRPA